MASINLIDDKVKPSHAIMTLAWPVFIEQVLSTLVQSVDTAMVGSLGATATASVSISATPMMLIVGIVMSFGMGFTALIARCVGAEDFDRANSLTRQAMTTVILLGVPIQLLCYSISETVPRLMGAEPDVLVLATIYNLTISYGMVFRVLTMVLSAIYRGYGDSKTPMFINTSVNIANVFGNYLLIYSPHDVNILGKSFHVWGAGWGVMGAAASTSIMSAVGAIVFLVLTFTRPTKLRISIRDSFKLKKKDMDSVIKISMPAVFERFTMGGASVVIASLVASLGTIAIASNSLAATVESFCYMPGFAFGAASTTLVGQALGARRPDKADSYVNLAIKMASALMAVLATLMFIFSGQLLTLFTKDPEVIATGSQLVKLLATIQVPYMISMIHSGALRGAGDTKGPFIITLFSMWGVRVLSAAVCVKILHFGIHSVILCMNTDNVVRMLLFWKRFKDGKWKETHF